MSYSLVLNLYALLLVLKSSSIFGYYKKIKKCKNMLSVYVYDTVTAVTTRFIKYIGSLPEQFKS